MPVAISGSHHVLHPGSWYVRPGTVVVRFLEPIDVAAFQPNGMDALCDVVHSRIAAALDETGEVPTGETLPEYGSSH